jgi:predicted dehydrogenase
VADHFRKHGGYELRSVADYFQDRVDALGEEHQVPANRRHTGLDGYRRLLEDDIDAVVIESPPYFHPRQVKDAVEAGKHVYLAKPAAVDVPGCRSVGASARQAAEKGLSFLVDFQTRTDPLYQEAVKRAQYGDIGRIVSGEAVYFCDWFWDEQAKWLRESPGDPEARLRAWALDLALSGDVLTEQNIHSLDVATWVLDAAPLRAEGTGGQGGRSLGDCWDHFSLTYTFPGDVVVTFCSKQLGYGWDDIGCRFFGTDGTLDTHYSGEVSIRGNLPYKGGTVESLYLNGVVRNVAAFHDAITGGDVSNPTVAPSLRSNLTTILGRIAARRGRPVTWDEMMEDGEELRADLTGLRS